MRLIVNIEDSWDGRARNDDDLARLVRRIENSIWVASVEKDPDVNQMEHDHDDPIEVVNAQPSGAACDATDPPEHRPTITLTFNGKSVEVDAAINEKIQRAIAKEKRRDLHPDAPKHRKNLTRTSCTRITDVGYASVDTVLKNGVLRKP